MNDISEYVGKHSPRSGRLKIAQRFIAGYSRHLMNASPRSGRQSVRFVTCLAGYFCRPFHGLRW